MLSPDLNPMSEAMNTQEGFYYHPTEENPRINDEPLYHSPPYSTKLNKNNELNRSNGIIMEDHELDQSGASDVFLCL
jgi:hypothetical protein